MTWPASLRPPQDEDSLSDMVDGLAQGEQKSPATRRWQAPNREGAVKEPWAKGASEQAILNYIKSCITC